MAKNKYQMMRNSIVMDSEGNNYPDLTTFPLETLVINNKPLEYSLTEVDTLRFFDLIYKYYDSFNFYDDIILWLSDIEDITLEYNFQKKIKLLSKKDLDSWYLSSLIGEEIKKSTDEPTNELEDL